MTHMVPTLEEFLEAFEDELRGLLEAAQADVVSDAPRERTADDYRRLGVNSVKRMKRARGYLTRVYDHLACRPPPQPALPKKETNGHGTVRPLNGSN